MPVVTLQKTNSVAVDTYLYQGNPTSNNATSDTLWVGNGASVNTVGRALLKFDLGLIPNDAIINSATLNITISSTPTSSREWRLHPLVADWVVGSVTWSTQPAFDSSKYVSKIQSNTTGATTIDVKTLVQDWVNGSYVNYGFLIKDADETTLNTSFAFRSFEYVTAANQPQLTIDYTIPTTGKKQVEYISTRTPVYQSSSSSITIPWPTGVQVGDTVFAQIAISSNSYTVTLPSGWKLEYTVNSSPYRFIIASKVLESGDTSPTFSVTSPVTWYGTLHLFRNVKSVNKITGRESGNTTQLQPTLSSLTATVPNTIAVIFNGMYSSLPGKTVTEPLNFAEKLDTGSNGYFLQMCYRYMHEKLTLTPSEVACNTSSSTSYNGSFLMMLEPIANNPPKLTLTSPADNLSLAEGSTFPIAGEASDADNGNVVTVKYKINNGTARAIASGVSDGSSPLSFAKSLTYSNKRLWDGAVDVTGADLAENVDHVLTVWAEDDQGDKSEEVTRKFQVIWNRPPTISGENSNLGIMEEPPSVEYTVTDPETNPFTITEKINGEVIRTFAGAAGQQETVTIPPDMWLRLEPGVQHALTIEASDDQGMTSTRTYTLTRFVDKIVFSLDFATMQQETKDFFTTDVAAKRLLLTPIWDLPPGAILLVEVCNNAYDAEPTWEDATIVVKLNRAHLFSNETKTADKWGINFRFQIEKGSATQPIYLKGVGGAFD